MSTSPNLLFYSNNCQMCQSLICILRNDNMLQYFKGFCVDNENVRKILPRNVTRVPTVIIPSINKIYVADEIFGWLQSIKMSRIQHSSVSSQIQSQNNIPSNNKKNDERQQTSHNIRPENNPIPFVTQEMSGLSDTYAYTTTDEIPRHTYMSCSEMNKDTIYTAPESLPKITQGNQKNYIQDAKRRREMQDNTIGELFKDQQKNIDCMISRRTNIDNQLDAIVKQQQDNIISILGAIEK